MNRSLKVQHYKSIDSTNAAAFRHARQGAPSGSVFVAEYQTEGHGKFRRKWVSPRGANILFSILLRPSFKAHEAPLVTQIACRSVARVLKNAFGLKTDFKRPNDILVKGRKICGVLVEAKSRSSGEVESLVIGVGLNVNSRSRELVPGATSLWEELGRKPSRQKLLKKLLNEFKEDSELYRWNGRG